MIRPGDIVYHRVCKLHPDPVAVTAAWLDGVDPIVSVVTAYEPVHVLRPGAHPGTYVVHHLFTDRVEVATLANLSANPD